MEKFTSLNITIFNFKHLNLIDLEIINYLDISHISNTFILVNQLHFCRFYTEIIEVLATKCKQCVKDHSVS